MLCNNNKEVKLKVESNKRFIWVICLKTSKCKYIQRTTFYLDSTSVMLSAEFTYRLDRLKPRASQFKVPPTKVYNIFNTVIGLSHLCCHNVLYFLNNPSVIFLTQLHSISEYCRILNTPHLLCLYWNWLNTLPSSSSRAGGVLGGAAQVDLA
jgi:hypothetical protein